MEITPHQDYNKSTTKMQQSWTCFEFVVEIKNFLSLQQVHNICNMFTTRLQRFTYMETPLRHVRNNPTTITTRSQQTYDWYPPKELQYSQQG